MSSNQPLVSVIVRTKDRPKFLKQAIQSIASQIYDSIEVVIINDGVCELDIQELENLLRNKSICYIKNKKSLGRSNAANRAV